MHSHECLLVYHYLLLDFAAVGVYTGHHVRTGAKRSRDQAADAWRLFWANCRLGDPAHK